MNTRTLITSCAALALVLGSTAHAKVLNGTILCDTNGDRQIDAGVDVPLVGVVVNIDESGGAAVGTAASEGDGTYFFNLPNQQNVDYQLTLNGATLPADATFIIPASGSYEFNSSDGIEFTRDWLIDSELCREVETSGCWMTGGGHWREARGTPRHNFGGNVFPSCSPDPGEGGEWNHVQRRNGVHVLGQSVDVVRCGNVGGIPDGSTSPVTPFNFIEFEGEGRLTGQGKNRIPEQDVYFFARAEDRNEPGSHNDRYFIHAFTDPGDPEGSTVLLTDVDGDASTVDPVVISGGNLQLHASSCDE